MSAFLVPLIFLAGLGRILQTTSGHYVPDSMLFLLGLWVMLTLSFARDAGLRGDKCPQYGHSTPLSRSQRPSVSAKWTFTPADPAKALALVTVYFAWRLVRYPTILYPDHRIWLHFTRGFLWLGFAGCAVTAILLARRARDGLVVKSALVAAGALVVARVFSIACSSNPFIDVYRSNLLAVGHLLAGVNPYAQAYPDIYGGHYDYPPGFVYWPGVLYAQTLSRVVLADIRAVFVVADVVIVVALDRVLRARRAPIALRATLPLAWLAFPVSLFVLESAWVDPLLEAAAALVFWALARGRVAWAGVALGAYCSVKQYAVVFALLCGLAVLVEWGWRAALKLVAAAIGAFAALMLPMVAWGPDAFWRATVVVPLTQGIRTDALSVVAMLQVERGVVMSGGMMSALSLAWLAAGALVLLGLQRRGDVLRGLACGTAVAYGGTFLVGKQAFCNYYHLVAFFVIVALGLIATPRAAPALAAESVPKAIP